MDKENAMAILAAADPSQQIVTESPTLEAIEELVETRDPKAETQAALFVKRRLLKIESSQEAETTSAENILLAYAFHADSRNIDQTLARELDNIGYAVVRKQLMPVIMTLIRSFGAQTQDYEDLRQDAEEVMWKCRKRYNGAYTYMAYAYAEIKNQIMKVSTSAGGNSQKQTHYKDIMLNRIRKAEAELAAQGITNPSDQVIADTVNDSGYTRDITATQVYRMRQTRANHVSLNDINLHGTANSEYDPEAAILRKDLQDTMERKVMDYDEPLQVLYHIRVQYTRDTGNDISVAELHKQFTAIPKYAKASQEYVRRYNKRLENSLARDMKDYTRKKPRCTSSYFTGSEQIKQEGEDIVASFRESDDWSLDPFGYENQA